MHRRLFLTLPFTPPLLAACALAQGVPPEAKFQLVPSGTLRAAINLGNPVLARKEGGELRGVSVDLARELAKRLVMPLQFVVYESAGSVVFAGASQAWDVAFVAIDPARGRDMLQTNPYLIIEGAYLVRADSPIRSVAELVAYAKANPGKLFYGSAGPGSAGHLTGELLRLRAGIDIVHVAYKGAAPAFADLLGGQIGADFDGMINAVNQARAGHVRLLAVSSERRLASHPDLPTIEETVKGVSGDSWFGLAAPAGLPASVAQRLEAEVLRALALPDVRSRLEQTGMTITGLHGAQFVEFIRADIVKWTPVVKAAKLDQGGK